MPATVATYYFDELEDWGHSIDFCNQELADLTEKLDEVIHRNSIVDIAHKVETQQAALDKITRLFYKLEVQIQEQEKVLRSEMMPAENKTIDIKTVLSQDVLRRNMQAAEKEFIDVKYNCHHFLSHLYLA